MWGPDVRSQGLKGERSGSRRQTTWAVCFASRPSGGVTVSSRRNNATDVSKFIAGGIFKQGHRNSAALGNATTGNLTKCAVMLAGAASHDANPGQNELVHACRSLNPLFDYIDNQICQRTKEGGGSRRGGKRKHRSSNTKNIRRLVHSHLISVRDCFAGGRRGPGPARFR